MSSYCVYSKYVNAYLRPLGLIGAFVTSSTMFPNLDNTAV